jgi:hypothetical protein
MVFDLCTRSMALILWSYQHSMRINQFQMCSQDSLKEKIQDVRYLSWDIVSSSKGEAMAMFYRLCFEISLLSMKCSMFLSVNWFQHLRKGSIRWSFLCNIVWQEQTWVVVKFPCSSSVIFSPCDFTHGVFFSHTFWTSLEVKKCWMIKVVSMEPRIYSVGHLPRLKLSVFHVPHVKNRMRNSW